VGVLPCQLISRRYQHFVFTESLKFAQIVKYSIGCPSGAFENARMQLPVVVSWVPLAVGLWGEVPLALMAPWPMMEMDSL
jgi:hypothetical protein